MSSFGNSIGSYKAQTRYYSYYTGYLHITIILYNVAFFFILGFFFLEFSGSAVSATDRYPAHAFLPARVSRIGRNRFKGKCATFHNKSFCC